MLTLLTVGLLAGFRNHLDLHPADAVSYMRDGIRLIGGDPPAWLLAWAPVSSALFGLLHACGVPLLALQDVAAVIVSVANVLALGWLLRPMVGASPALVVAALWATTRLVLHREGTVPPPTYLLGATLLWCSAGCAVRGRHVFGGLLLVLAALERGETALLGVACAVAFALLARGRRGARAAWLYVAVGLAMLVFQQLHEASAVARLVRVPAALRGRAGHARRGGRGLRLHAA